jgi:hypothetical protein
MRIRRPRAADTSRRGKFITTLSLFLYLKTLFRIKLRYVVDTVNSARRDWRVYQQQSFLHFQAYIKYIDIRPAYDPPAVGSIIYANHHPVWILFVERDSIDYIVACLTDYLAI